MKTYMLASNTSYSVGASRRDIIGKLRLVPLTLQSLFIKRFYLGLCGTNVVGTEPVVT